MDTVAFYEKALRQIDAEVETQDVFILDGASDTLVAYKAAVARRNGLLAARGILEDLFGRANSEE